MNQSAESLHLAGSCRATYLVRVLENVSARYLNYFDEISIVVDIRPNLAPITTLCLHDSDQATLFGLLSHLYDFGHTLLYVEQLVLDENK